MTGNLRSPQQVTVLLGVLRAPVQPEGVLQSDVLMQRAIAERPLLLPPENKHFHNSNTIQI